MVIALAIATIAVEGAGRSPTFVNNVRSIPKERGKGLGSGVNLTFAHRGTGMRCFGHGVLDCIRVEVWLAALLLLLARKNATKVVVGLLGFATLSG